MPQNRGARGLRLTAGTWSPARRSGGRFGFARLDRATRREIDWALDQVGARDLARRPIGELSGGERQRVLLSQALLGRPRLLLLDEPLISLDPAHQRGWSRSPAQLRKDSRSRSCSAPTNSTLVNAIDRVLYLGGGAAVLGAVDEVVTGPVLSAPLSARMIEVVRRQGIAIFVMAGDVESSATRTADETTGTASRTITERRAMLEYDFMRTAFAAAGVVAISREPSGTSWCCAARPSPAMRSLMSASPARRARCCSACRRLCGPGRLHLVAGIGMGLFGEKLAERDVAIGMMLSLALGLGLLFLHFYTRGDPGGGAPVWQRAWRRRLGAL